MAIGHLLALLLLAGPLGAWFTLYGLIRRATRPGRPQPAPATQDLPGTEPPAVVSLLANHWRLTEDAAGATLIDLAARHFLEFRQPGNDPRQTTIHVRDPHPDGLNAYERRVFDRVVLLARDGVVPLTALSFRDVREAASFRRRLRAGVVTDARARGLSRRRFSRKIRSVLTAAAVAAATGVGVATVPLVRWSGNERDALVDGIRIGVIVFGLLSAIAHAPAGERDTPAGLEVAARWLGVKAWLARTEQFAELPPAAVAAWDRYLSYGDALGTTPVCATTIDLGLGNRRRVWSSYGGAWHLVRIRYPGLLPWYGRPLPALFGAGVLAVAAGVLLFLGVAGASDDAAAGMLAAFLVIGIVLVACGLGVLITAAADALRPRTVTGQVLWKQVCRRRHQHTKSPVLYYLAVDDGTGERVTAWGLPARLSGPVGQNDTVTLRGRRWSRRITALTVRAPVAEPAASPT